MQYKTLSFATLVAVAASVVAADSAPFALMNTRSGSQYHFSNWGYNSDGQVVIASLAQGATEFSNLVIKDDTSVQNSDGQSFIINDDFSITLGTEGAATGFSVGESTGALTPFNYNGVNGFTVCPNNGAYQLYSQRPADAAEDCVGLGTYVIFNTQASSSAAASTTAAPVSSSAPASTLSTSSAEATSSVPVVSEITGAAGKTSASVVGAAVGLAAAFLL